MKGKWIKICSLAISFPSSIFGIFWLNELLADHNVFTKKVGHILAIAECCLFLFLMVFYAYKTKD